MPPGRCIMCDHFYLVSLLSYFTIWSPSLVSIFYVVFHCLSSSWKRIWICTKNLSMCQKYVNILLFTMYIVLDVFINAMMHYSEYAKHFLIFPQSECSNSLSIFFLNGQCSNTYTATGKIKVLMSFSSIFSISVFPNVY